MRIIAFVIRFPLALLFVVAGVSKLGFGSGSVEMFSTLGMEPTGRWIVGILETLVAGLLVFPRTVAAGALLGWGVMSGAIIAHLTVLGVQSLMGAMLGIALSAWVGCGFLLVAHRREIGFVRCMFACQRRSEDSRSS